MIAAIGELIDAIDCLAAGLAGWRYLLSPSYRKQTHAVWKEKTNSCVALEILGGVVGLCFTLSPLGLLLYLVS